MMSPHTNWAAAARSASSEAQLLRIANEFLALWRLDELAALPRDCQVRRLADLEAVANLAFSLVRHECSIEPVDHPAVLQAMARFFAAASVRGAELRALSRGFRPIGIPTIAAPGRT